MHIRIRHISRTAPETVRRATHDFAAPSKGIGIDHSHVLKLRPRRCAANGGRTGEPSRLARKSGNGHIDTTYVMDAGCARKKQFLLFSVEIHSRW